MTEANSFQYCPIARFRFQWTTFYLCFVFYATPSIYKRTMCTRHELLVVCVYYDFVWCSSFLLASRKLLLCVRSTGRIARLACLSVRHSVFPYGFLAGK